VEFHTSGLARRLEEDFLVFLLANQLKSLLVVLRGCRILMKGQLLDCNNLSGSNSLINWILNKKLII
jgi:hypothetical protein